MNVRSLSTLVAALSLVAPAAQADTCREWLGEHTQWKIETVRRYLKGAPTGDVESAVFEVLQREAYLTSCELPVEKARSEMIGWRLVDRTPEEFGSAVLEGVLEVAGFDPDLRRLFEVRHLPPVPPEPVAPVASRNNGGRYRWAR